MCVCVCLCCVPDRDEQDHEQRKDHLHVGYRIHSKGAENQQLHHLQEGEVVDLPLRNLTDVVGGGVGCLGAGDKREKED